MSRKNLIPSLILRHPILNLALIVIITIVLGFFTLRLKFDTSLSAFVIKKDPDMLYYEKLKKMFDTDETVFITFKAKNLFSKEDLEVIEELSEKIEDLDYVRNVKSLTNANLITTTPDSFAVEALVDGMPETIEESQKIKKNATTNYIYIKDITSADGDFGSLLIDIKNAPGEKPTKKVVLAIKEILNDISKKTNLKFYLGGDAIINYSLGEYMKDDFFRFLLPTYLILALLLMITIGRLRDIIVSLVTISLALIWTTGIMSLLGKTFNNVTVGILPLILCISLEDIYYIHHHYYISLKKFKDKFMAWKETLGNMWSPCLFTSLTTVIGFASLMVNNIKPILDFSLLGSIAVTLAYIITIIFLPSIHLLLRMPQELDKKIRFKINYQPFINKLANVVYNKRRVFWLAIPLLIIFSAFGISKIKIETDHLSFFHKSSEVYKSTVFTEKNLAGISNLEVTVKTPNEDEIKNPQVLLEIEKLSEFLRKQKNIDKAISIADFLKDMNRAMHDNDESYYRIPETRELVAQYLLVYSMSPRRNEIEKDFVNYPYDLARIRCRMSEHSSTEILGIINKIKKYAANNIAANLEVKITSYPVIYSNMVDSLARGQLKTLILVFFALLIAAAIYFKSFIIGLLAMIANSIPIIFTLGIMGFTGTTLNIATAMTAGIAIGLALDDTTHFFSRFHQKFPQNPDYIKGSQETLVELGETMSYSSFLMIAGYLILVLSQFRLTVFFGLLCALTIFTALLCDLLITPWLIMTFKPKFK